MSTNEFDPPKDRAASTLADEDIVTESKLTRRLVIVAGAGVAAATAAGLGIVFGKDLSTMFERRKPARGHTD